MFEILRNGRTSVRSFPFGRLILIGVVAALLVRIFVFQIYLVSSESMEPTLKVDDRIGVFKLTGDVKRGDVVVVDGYGSFTLQTSTDFATTVLSLLGFEKLENRYFVKRVIGIGGDSIKCCSTAGELLVNGEVLNEPYLAAEASTERFDVLVPAGHVWLMGDNRSESRDSRNLLGQPGGGMIPDTQIVGQVKNIVWPPARMRTLNP